MLTDALRILRIVRMLTDLTDLTDLTVCVTVMAKVQICLRKDQLSDGDSDMCDP
jgi:hypothetical protein